MILNETPVRTAKNFAINNINIEDIKVLEKVSEFNNITITADTTNVDIEQDASKINLTYGLNEVLTNQINFHSNKNLKLIAKGKENSETQIEFKFDIENNTLVDNIEIVAEENTKSTIIVKYIDEEGLQAYHNGAIRVNAKENSNIDVIIVNFMNTKSSNFIAIENTLEQNSKVNFCIVDFGGKESITNYYSNIIGKNVNNNLNTIYLGKENQIFDLNYIAELRGEKSNIDIDVQGALKDNSKKHFKGTIDFKKGCKKATRKRKRILYVAFRYCKIPCTSNAIMFRRRCRRKSRIKCRKSGRKGIILYHEQRI